MALEDMCEHIHRQTNGQAKAIYMPPPQVEAKKIYIDFHIMFLILIFDQLFESDKFTQ